MSGSRMTAPEVPEASISPLATVPIRARQFVVLAGATLLAALDGFDALSMSFVAPAVSREWILDKAVVGLLLSSGLVGMALGSIALSPLADKVGRRPVVLAALVLMTAGSLWSAFAHSVGSLAAARVLTGVGIGTMVAITTLLSAEFANARRSALVVAVVATIGFPLGGVVGGLGAAAILRASSWPWVFVAGAIGGGLLLILFGLFMPESPSFLIARRPPHALARLNHVLSGLGHAPVAALPPSLERRRASYADLFTGEAAPVTWRLIAVNVLVIISTYYVLQWLPQLVADAGFPPATGSMVSAASGLVGFGSGVLVGGLASRIAPTRLAGVTMSGLALSLVAIGLAPASVPAFIGAAGSFGLFLAGTTGIFYAILAQSFPPLSRASGVGLVMGVGRAASAIGPALAGWMFAHGLSRAVVSASFALGPAIGAALIMTFSSRAARAPGAAGTER